VFSGDGSTSAEYSAIELSARKSPNVWYHAGREPGARARRCEQIAEKLRGLSMKRLMPVALCALTFGFAAAAQRLPTNVIPESYDLTFTPNLEKATFSGEETIHVRLLKPAKTITLNSAEIEFQEVKITSGSFHMVVPATTDEKSDQVTFTVPVEVPARDYEIHIRYTGILNDKLRGFYLSQTPKRRYAVTQFESTDARRAFPCFDEPAYKAVYNIKLVIDKGDTAISNGKIVSDSPGPGDGKHTLTFSPSPKMSTYLVAMMVGDFVCKSGAADGIPIRVCTVPGKENLVGWALTSAENILKFYDTYYYTKYPFQKLDIIAFPDFAAGAMENAAAITYRETDLLIEDKTAPLDARENVTSVLAHEMAHQWFGDFVTMKWWDDIWLNEGVATWMAWKPMEAWKPEWHNSQSEIQETDGALTTDSISSIRPIRSNANTPAEIDALFDEIAYEKAASVLRMVEAYVGKDLYRKGVNEYLQAHQYGNATAEDFWSTIAKSSGKPVDKIMKSFIDQPGAPVISVKSECAGDVTKVTLAQKRFFADGKLVASGSKEVWQIPIALRAAGSKISVYKILSAGDQTFDLPGCARWVFANAGGRGYYRTEYDGATFGKISLGMEESFSPEERIHFLGDGWAMVRAGRLNVGDYLTALQYFAPDRNRAVIDEAIGVIPKIHDAIASPADRPAFETWVRKFLGPIENDLSPEKDKPAPPWSERIPGIGGTSDMPGMSAGPPDTRENADRAALETDVLRMLIAYGNDPALIAKARLVAEQYMTNSSSVDAQLAQAALRTVAQSGDAALYDRYMDHLRKAKTPEEYYAYFFALASFRDPVLTKRTFEFVLSPEVRNQDMGLINALFNSDETQSAAWDLLKLHFKELQTKAGADIGGGGGGFVGVAGQFCDVKMRDESQEFFAAQHVPGTERPLRNAKDRVNSCIALRSLQQNNLSEFLKR
jgi:aminopeptidase N